MDSLLDGKLIETSNDESRILILKVSNLTIATMIYNEKENLVKVIDIYNETPLCIEVDQETNERNEISLFQLITVKDWKVIDNINVDAIIDSYSRIQYNNMNLSTANLFVKVYQAFLEIDDCKRKDILKQLLKKLSYWDIKNSTFRKDISYINYCLYKKEFENLTADDFQMLESIILESNNNEIKFAIYVIFGIKTMADLYLSKIKKDILPEIKTYPIYIKYLEL